MSAPTVSVVMNCYNGARDLPAALASVREQTWGDYEIVFWDNASTDGSGEIAGKFGAKLRYFRGERNVSLGAARNLALAEARGEYIAFLDCDDLWRPEKLAEQMALFRANPALGVVCTDTEIMRDGKIIGRVFETSPPERGMAFAALMRKQWISMSSAMVSRRALEQIRREATAVQPSWFDESLHVCEEADVFYRVARGWEIDYIDKPLTVWRVHGANTTFRKFGQIADETMAILAKHRALYPGYDAENADLVELLTRRAAFQRAAALWKNGEGAEARRVVAPWLNRSFKYRLFWLASFLPGSLFDKLAGLYFSLPAALRRS